MFSDLLELEEGVARFDDANFILVFAIDLAKSCWDYINQNSAATPSIYLFCKSTHEIGELDSLDSMGDEADPFLPASTLGVRRFDLKSCLKNQFFKKTWLI